MALEDLILELPDFVIKECSGRHEVTLRVSHGGDLCCINCGSARLRKKCKRIRQIRHLSFGDSNSTLHVESIKFVCLDCGKYFYQRYPGIMPRARSSEPFRKQVYLQHIGGMSQRTLSHRHKISPASIERWTHTFLNLEDSKQDRSCLPRVLGIDEHFFTKKKGYVTTFADLSKHCVYDVQLGRSEASLAGYLGRLKGRDRVQVIVMDLSPSYRSLVRKYFPHAKIVSDRFHVVRSLTQTLLETWKLFDEVGRKNRGLISLMRRKPENLNLDQVHRLKNYLQSLPGFDLIYEKIQELQALMRVKHRTKKQCSKLIPKLINLIEEIRSCPIGPLQTLGKTLDSWKEEIVRMWRFTKTNSITEGLHTRMEELQRRAYGFRNFQNYRLRVRTLIGYRKQYL